MSSRFSESYADETNHEYWFLFIFVYTIKTLETGNTLLCVQVCRRQHYAYGNDETCLQYFLEIPKLPPQNF